MGARKRAGAYLQHKGLRPTVVVAQPLAGFGEGVALLRAVGSDGLDVAAAGVSTYAVVFYLGKSVFGAVDVYLLPVVEFAYHTSFFAGLLTHVQTLACRAVGLLRGSHLYRGGLAVAAVAPQVREARAEQEITAHGEGDEQGVDVEEDEADGIKHDAQQEVENKDDEVAYQAADEGYHAGKDALQNALRNEGGYHGDDEADQAQDERAVEKPLCPRAIVIVVPVAEILYAVVEPLPPVGVGAATACGGLAVAAVAQCRSAG